MSYNVTDCYCTVLHCMNFIQADYPFLNIFLMLLWSVMVNVDRWIFDFILSSDADRVKSSFDIGIDACSALLAALIVASSITGPCCKTFCLTEGFRPVLMASRILLLVKTGFVLSCSSNTLLPFDKGMGLLKELKELAMMP